MSRLLLALSYGLLPGRRVDGAFRAGVSDQSRRRLQTLFPCLASGAKFVADERIFLPAFYLHALCPHLTSELLHFSTK